MKSLLVVSILVAMTASTLAQTTRTTSPESQKGGPASRESKPNAGGQETVTKGAGPTSATPSTGRGTGAAGGTPAPK
jgi:hypothetical protein